MLTSRIKIKYGYDKQHRIGLNEARREVEALVEINFSFFSFVRKVKFHLIPNPYAIVMAV